MERARNALKRVVGRVAEFVLPELGRELDEVRNTTRAPRLKKAILYARLRRAQSRDDIPAMEGALAAFWKSNEGDKFHGHFVEERIELFRDQHAHVVDKLAGVLAESGARFSRLVEVGCGDGTVLAYCAERLAEIPEAIGLDINAAVITRSSAEYSQNDRLSFVEAEGRNWLSANPQPGTVMLSSGGVLEYISQHNLDRLLHVLAQSPPAAVVLIEPVAPGHDLQSESGSFAFGHEKSFSHNHRHRLVEAGFDVVFAEEKQIHDVRWMLMIGLLR